MTILSEKTYWKIGGECKNFIEVSTVKELQKQLKYFNSFLVIGNGTNVLFDSKGFTGTIFKLGSSFDYLNVLDGNTVEVGAAAFLPTLVRKLSVLGFGGVEHCVGIPATMGGLVCMTGGTCVKCNIWGRERTGLHGLPS